MAEKKERKPPDPPPGPGEWIVTFTDCMTLLLCFFVLLLAFSTFEEGSLQDLNGAFGTDDAQTIFMDLRRAQTTIEPKHQPTDIREEGARVRTEVQTDTNEPPLAAELTIGDEAYKDRKTLRMPSGMLFAGRGAELTENGKRRLDLIASFLLIKPCRVVLGENRPPRAQGMGYVQDIGLKRSWAVMDYLAEAGVDWQCFSISAEGGGSSQSSYEPTMEIVMLSKEIHW